MLAVVRVARPTATAAVAVATAAAFRKARTTSHRSNSSINNSYNSNSNNKLGWHDVGGDRGLQGQPLVGIDPGRVEPPLAHWEKRSHALLGLLVAR